MPVDSTGLVSISDLLHEITPETTLVSVMAVNNEVGTIQNIKAIGDILKDYKAYFHVDAVQAISCLHFDVKAMKIDAMTMSSHKLHGPKGVGALYVRTGVPIKKFMAGGEQELNRRGGTVNVPAVVGFAKAMEIADKDDIIILAGKGHETYQVIGDTNYDFNERDIIREILAK